MTAAAPSMALTPLLRMALAALLLALLALDQALPPPIPATEPGSVIVAADGTPLRTYPSADGIWRQPVSPDQVSPHYLQALLGYEDRWFFWHPGVNPVAMGRAAWQWARTGHVVSGGSTLTMQVARILEPVGDVTSENAAPRSLRAKARQVLRALQLELRLSKREILTLYLNYAPMGGIVQGVEMASRSYLGHSAASLSPAEAALLATLPQAPSRLRPDRHPQAAQQARDKLLARMQALRQWLPAQVDDARSEPVAVQPLRAHWLAPLAAERLHSRALAQRQHSRQLSSQPVRSTLNAELQASIERMLLDRVDALPPKVSMAVLVLDNDSLAILAYAGSADFNDARRAAHVDMTRGVRSPGSTLKPFLYAMALEEGLIHSESLLVDAPQSFGGYQPGNFQAAFSGPVSASEALQKSLNVPAVDLLDRIGPTRFAAQLRGGGLRLRMPKGEPPNLSLILGGAGTTLAELVGAYRALARDGLAGLPRLSPDEPRVESRLMSAGAAFIVRDILETGGHPQRPYAEGPRRLAWKTGTSFGFRDAWALGVTPGHTIGVWVGRPDGTPNPGHFGANTAAPLLHDIAAVLATQAGADYPARPASVSAAQSCWPLGLALASTDPAHCLQQRQGWALNGAVPPTLPDRGRSDGLLWPAGVCADGSAHPAMLRWPVALSPFLADAGMAPDAASAQPGQPGCEQDRVAATALQIVGINDGAVLRPAPGHRSIDIRLDALGQARTPTKPSVPTAPSLYWLVDGQQQPSSVGGRAWTLRLNQPGPHRITALDGQGRHRSVTVTVQAP